MNTNTANIFESDVSVLTINLIIEIGLYNSVIQLKTQRTIFGIFNYQFTPTPCVKCPGVGVYNFQLKSETLKLNTLTLIEN
ncbi:MAG: hypothetical protein Greene041679_614 [Parcubacteria group bacterium Greene0416_79]|nr:MAG: hypothetical protein Greene041679_614 [Parcubacteria group bacterium Greene0416_79]